MKKLKEFEQLIKNYLQNEIYLPIISDFLEWFWEKIKIHFNKNTPNLKFQKWDIYFVNLWKNIWSELNKTRPCIIYSKKSFNNKNWVIIIPLKSFKWKIIEKFQVKIEKNKWNWLEKDSIVDIFQIKNISTKRLNKYIWKLDKKYFNEIDNKISNMLWLKKQE